MVRAAAVAVAPGPLLVHCFGLFWSWRATAGARAGMDFVRVDKAAEKVEECIGFRLRQRFQQPSRDDPCRAGEFVEQCFAGGREGVGGGATIVRFGLADDCVILFVPSHARDKTRLKDQAEWASQALDLMAIPFVFAQVIAI